ncbi:MAG: hypothetical protein NTZ10_06095 [Candidatus Saganbacteria bacterium]|nr:hypothetical protein [Candidatus Saganbacteria bacterium]
MKKRVMAMILAASLIAVSVSAAVALSSKLIDNFESNIDLKSPEWWHFGYVTVSVEKNPAFRPGDKVAKSCGKYSMVIKGSANDWYCGGVGSYIGVDASGYSGMEMCVYGYGPGSGKLKIELYDDDKGSWQTQYDRDWIPLKDDIWKFEQDVDWRGWKKIYIPFSSFVVSNPKRGDGILNLDQNKGSGGLLQVQFILIASSKDGEANIRMDNVSLVTRSEESEE